MRTVLALSAVLCLVALASAATPAPPTVSYYPARYCTYTKGAYGSSCPNPLKPTTQPGCIRDACFPTAFPQGITIGPKHFSSSAQVDAYLPGPGSENLLAQTLTLTISLGFDSPAAGSNLQCKTLLQGTRSQLGELKNVLFAGSGPLLGVSFGDIVAAATAMLNAGRTSATVNGKTVTSADFLVAIEGINSGAFPGNQFHECQTPGDPAVDTVPPMITVPNLPCQTATSISGATVTYTVTASDNVDAVVTATCTPASGSVFPIGSTTVSCSATDAAGNTASTTFNIQVCDNTPPVIDPVIGGPVPVGQCFSATSAAGVAVTYTQPTATDAVGGSVPVNCAPLSGSVFPVGTTTVRCTADDGNGNVATFNFDVEVCDTIPPVLTQPNNIPCVEATSPQGATVTFPLPPVTDAVDPNPTVTCTPASGSTFALGTTTVTCTAVDMGGNNALPVAFTVKVCDTAAPSICNEPAPIPCVEATSPLGAVVYYSPPTATDVVDTTTPVTCRLPSGAWFPVGLNHVICDTVDAAGNRASVTFTVEVCDTIPPVISQPPNVPCVEATSPAGAVVTYYTPKASDAADPNVVVTCVLASGSTFAVGTSTVVCSAKDASGNAAISVTFSVQVCDHTPPVIVDTPSDIPCVEATSPQGAVVYYTNPTATDIVDVTVLVRCSPASGSVFAVGTTVVLCTANDAHGNPASTSFTVEVCDHTPPIIHNTPNNIPCQEATSPAGAVVSYIHPTAQDIVDGAVLVTCVLPAGSTFPIGISVVICTAIDAHGNSASTSFTVEVCDRTPPVIHNTPNNIPCQEATSPAGRVLTYQNPTATDIVDLSDPVSCVPASGSTFPIGSTTVTCTSVDSHGNSASTSFTVLVCDQTPPIISQPPNIPCVEATSPQGAVVTYPTPAVFDIADPTVVVTCDKPSGSVFFVGAPANIVKCIATDAYGNVATPVYFTIDICDRTPPVIVNTPADIPCVEATSPAGAVVRYVNPTSDDIVDGAVAVNCVLASGSVFAIGVNTVTCTATDAHGNSAYTTFTVEVCDRTPPTIHNTPRDIPCVEATSPAGAVVTWVNPTATDIVDVTDPVYCVAASGSTFAIGTTTVTCTSTDARGNSASTSFTVTVCDRTPPVIHDTPQNIPCVEATSPAGAVVTYINPNGYDIVDLSVAVSCVLSSGSTFAVGLNTVTCTSCDSRANCASTSFTIEICDRTPPVIHDTPNNIPCVEATSAAGAVVTYTLPTATDIVDVSTAVFCVPASGSTFAIGITTVTCTSKDAHNNQASTSFTVEVCDDTAPVIIGTPANIPCVEATSPLGALVPYTIPNATDAVDSTASLQVTCTQVTPVCTTQGRNCITDLSFTGAGDLYIKFTLQTNQKDHQFEILNQRLSCINGANPPAGWWSIRAIAGGACPSGNCQNHLTFEIGGSQYSVVAGTKVINDGMPHVVVAQRVGGIMSLIVDCMQDGPTVANAANLRQLDAFGYTDGCVGADGTTAFNYRFGSLNDVCLSRTAPAPGPTPGSGFQFQLGVTTVVCSVTDAHGNSASSSFTVEVCDTTPPEIHDTPQNVPCVEATSPLGAVVSYTMPTATDIYDGAVAVSCSPLSGSMFAVGVNTVTCSASDSHGNSATTTFTIEVCDRTPPTIHNPPPNVPCVEATSPAGAAVTWVDPTATDIVDGAVGVVCTPASGALFALGTSTVTCTAFDLRGNSASVSFTVQVCDQTPPTIYDTPRDIPCGEATGPQGLQVSYTLPTADDIVSGVVPVTCTPASGSFFPVGVSTVTCSATDGVGLTTTTSFKVYVCDTTPPVVSQPPNVPCVEATGPSGAVVTYALPTANDLVTGTDVTIVCTPASGSVFPVGLSTVTCSAADWATNPQNFPRNTAYVTFTVDVCDSKPPVIVNPPPNITCTEATSAAGAVVNYQMPTASDLVDGATVVSCVPPSGSVFAISTTVVVCSTADSHGNAASYPFTVTVCDTKPPTINQPPNIPCVEATSPAGRVVSYTTPGASDIVDGAVTVSCTPASGSVFPIATTTVTCTASDARGNTASVTFTVQVCDRTAPVICLPPDVPCTNAVDSNGAHVTYPTPSVTDAADPTVQVTCLPAPGSLFPIGLSTVYCNAVDAHNNHAVQVSFTVEVCDNSNPTVTPNQRGPVPVATCFEATSPQGAVVTYNEPTATDSVGGSLPVTCVPRSGSVFGLGSTTVTCTAADSFGNSALNSFVIDVCDTIKPVITQPANIPCVEATSAAGAVVHFAPPTAADAADPTVPVTCVPASGSRFAIGTTTVSCTVADASGNAADAVTFTVSVCDATAPALTGVPTDIPCTEATSPQGATVTYAAPSAVDVVNGAVAVTCSPASGSTFAIGTTTVTCSTADAAGNGITASFTVQVCDSTAPVIAAHANVPCVEATTPQGAVVNYALPTVTDIASPATLVVTCVRASGSVFPLGVSTVTCTAVDAAGNTAVPISFTVSVCDSYCPTFATFPNPVIVGPTAFTSAGSVVTFPFPTASDSTGSPVTISCNRVSGATFPLGLTTVTCSAYDAAGNNCPRSFNVLVCYYGTVPTADQTACVATIPTGDYCTYSQAQWGDAATANVAAGLRARCLAAVYPANVVIGDLLRTYPAKNEAPYYAQWTSSAAVDAFLPTTGAAAALATDATNPTTSAAGVLAGQVLALAFNVDFDRSTVILSGQACRVPRAAGVPLIRDLVFVDPASPLNGDTVATILSKANAFLARSSTAYTAAVISDAVDKINSNFADCSTNKGFLKVNLLN